MLKNKPTDKGDSLFVVPEDRLNTIEEDGRLSRSLPGLTVVPPCSSTNSVNKTSATFQHLNFGDESMTVVVSAFYAKILIVLGIALPVTSTLQNERSHAVTSDVFSIYLYVVSMLFLGYIFYHLRIAKREKNENTKRTRYGSFYLHIGVAGFGVGSIIYSCLQIGEYFDLSGECQHFLIIVKPVCRILFMAAQAIFIFSYTDILDPMRGVVLDRFGLMHLIATNVCEWFNVVIQETRDDILSIAYKMERPMPRYAYVASKPTFGLETAQSILEDTENNKSVNLITGCNVSDMIIPLIKSSNPYLRPCGVEYSLLCSVIIAVIWNDICTVPGKKSFKKTTKCNGSGIPLNNNVNTRHNRRSVNHFSVDCAKAQKGLFVGIAVLAGTIVSLMLFYGLFQKKDHVELALLQVIYLLLLPTSGRLFVVMAASSSVCIQRIRHIPVARIVTHLPMEHALLLVTQCGVYLYYLFEVIGAAYMIHKFSEHRRPTRIIAPLCAIVESSCQTLLVLDAWCRRCSPPQLQRRPGRQLLTFLLLSNYALWLMNRVKNARAEFHPMQMEFYGVWAWTLITHVSVPLLVCYRFQATVCFYEIWKNAYKPRKNQLGTDYEDVELKNHST